MDLRQLAGEVLAERPLDTDPAWSQWSLSSLTRFYRHIEHGEFISRDGKEIHYGLCRPNEANAWVVISPGRVESYIKYQEVALELVAAGYAVAMIDHRGQGHSSRLTTNPQQGHVGQFIDYAEDFAEWLDHLRGHFQAQPVFLLAHSMGGAISMLYLQQVAGRKGYQPSPFSKAALSAPMMGINTAPWPLWLAKPMTRSLAALNQLLSPKRYWYAPGTGDYATEPFAINRLSHSEARYHWFSQMYTDLPAIKVGGPTNHWVAEGVAAADEVVRLAHRVEIPVLLLQGDQDIIVAAEPQKRFIDQLPNPQSRLEPVAGAKHEILMETDAIRAPAIAAVMTFFQDDA
ncbi:MAG: alpha/beta fold hydrolase [Aliidiomarina sp.]|uniref:alpha/beta fold hydrolase n=1 Tax=Aliidiomarina sp. TaxID=1872439 RepID=UPI0025C2EE5C|nr:alpha/beta fold hydrolase [Aliidiomarina sp.]MCH8500715.1 alpha/beta fold hydrolase [Aliidiomarina sp.]